MPPTDLADCEEDFGDLLADVVPLVEGGQRSATAYFNVELAQRVLGLCSLLARAEVDAFVDRLERSGTARLELLKFAADGAACEPPTLAVTKSVGFPAALAAGNVELAAAIGRAMPATHDPEYEYEDDFLFIDLMRRAAVGIADRSAWLPGAAQALARWTVVLKKRPSPHRDVWQAMVDSDQAVFTKCFPALVDYRIAQLAQYRKQSAFAPKLFAAEGQVWIEGLALLELAGRLGLATEPDYPLLPSLARSQRSRNRGPVANWLSE